MATKKKKRATSKKHASAKKAPRRPPSRRVRAAPIGKRWVRLAPHVIATEALLAKTTPNVVLSAVEYHQKNRGRALFSDIDLGSVHFYIATERGETRRDDQHSADLGTFHDALARVLG